MTWREATAGDLADIVALEAEGFEQSRWSEASWRAEVDRDDRLVMWHTEPQAAACFSVLDDVAELLRIVVAREGRRRGIARALLSDGLWWARIHGARRMLLEVRHTNEPAIRLYESAGFDRIFVRQNYYGAGSHAIVMEREVA